MSSTGSSPTSESVWSQWGDRLLATLAVGLVLCIAWWWLGTTYLDLPLSTYLSWKPDDLPVAVPPHVPEAILGRHYFGDFQEARWWGSDVLEGRSPYRYLNIYAPLAPLIMVPFAALPLVPAFGAYCAISAAAMLVPAWMLLRGLRPARRIITVALLGGATAPFLVTLDRGNLQGVTIGLVGFSIVALQRRRVRWACALLALAVCLKPFVLLIALAAILRKRRSFATNTIAVVLAISVTAWLALPDSRIDNLGNIVRGQLGATNGPDLTAAERVWANTSLHGLLANIERLAGELGGTVWHFDTPHFSGLIVTLTCLVGVGVVTWRRRVPQWVWGIMVLATLQLAQPYASMYTASWATLAAVLFGLGSVVPADLAGRDNERVDRWIRSLRVLAVCALAATLLPLALRPEVGGHFLAVQQIMSPGLWLAFGVVALAASLARPAPAEMPAAALIVPDGSNAHPAGADRA